ncbi:MAG TPA: PQQ-binding-like beta-propeller repeat protein [Burkholderiales bacterium]|nr:PQQ-binding-like beta-propeller repeat protein [Burkholderiales bacterium]
MPACKRLGALTSFASACLLLAACGGGGGYGGGGSGGGGGGYSAAPYILASLVSFPTGAVPLGFVPPNFNTGASVLIQNSSSGAPIANASVSINGVALAYSVTNQDYEGNIAVAPGDGVSLSVSVGGTTYAASGTQFTSYPTISAPLAGATWSSLSTNLVTWSGGAPTLNALYALGVLDSADPSGQLVWPSGNTIQILPTSTTSFFINPNSLTAGGRLVIVGIADFVGIPNAAASSGIVISGFNYVSITVTDIPPVPSPATLVSIAVTPSNPSIANGATVQLTATGTYSDSSTQDLTTQVTWSSSDSSKAMVSSTGLATAIATGPTTLSATSGNISGSTQANAFQPSTPSPDWVTFQGDAAHAGFVDAQFDPALFAQIWSWSRPAGDPEPIGGINSVATTAGKVMVTKDIYFGQGAIYALNEADGTLDWTYAFGSMASEGPPAVWNGNVFVPTTDPGEHCVTWAIDATLGTHQFQMPSTCQWSNFFAPTALDGSVLLAAEYGSVYSYSIFSGGLQWEMPAGAYDQSTPAGDAQYAYQYGIGTGSPALKVFDRMTGATVASIPDPFASSSDYSMFSAPMLGANGDAIVFSGGGFSGRAASSSEQFDSRPLVSYNIPGKSIAWRSANAYLTHPAIANGVIYAARNAPATLDALSEADGHILWSWTPPAGNTSFHRNTIVTNNLVFASTDANVYAIDLNTHQAVWHYPKPGMLAISGNSILYIATGATLSDGNLVAIKLK